MSSTRQRAIAVHPVATLRQQATALEAAITLVLIKPRRTPVHALRTATRRVEAQLQILCLLEPETPVLGGVERSSRKIKKLLDAVRRTAGKVRDLDVQREAIKQSAKESKKKRPRQEARYLREELKAQRHEEAAALLAELGGHARRLAPKLEKLLLELEPAAQLAVPSGALTGLIRRWYQAHAPATHETEHELHGVRKAAKLARYMAESGAPAGLAKQFERTQDLGGTWHDALTLRQTARDHLGKHAVLVQTFSRKERRALQEFHGSIHPQR